jgi:cytochrome c peroxidase
VCGVLAGIALSASGFATPCMSGARPKACIVAPPLCRIRRKIRPPRRTELGKTLFFDPRLSGSDAISCAACHSPAFSWGDTLPKGIRHGSKPVGRRTPTVLNTAFAECGERVEFCNADDVTHNAFSRSNANAFNIKTQMPGASSVVEFTTVGVTEVRGAIHPAMKLIVTVKE